MEKVTQQSATLSFTSKPKALQRVAHKVKDKVSDKGLRTRLAIYLMVSLYSSDRILPCPGSPKRLYW